MAVRFVSKCFLFIIVFLLSMNTFALANEDESIFDCNVLLGVGTFYHHFSGSDDFRKGSGLFGDDDEITGMGGLDFHAELLLNDTFSLSLPFGLGVGYKIQTMEGGYKYSTTFGYTIERKVQIINNIGYATAYIPLGDARYWLIGCSAGLGASSYKISWEGSNPAYNDTKDSASGMVIPLSLFIDWGADGFGGRAGYTYVLSDYDDILGSTPDGDGSQFFIELRYAI